MIYNQKQVHLLEVALKLFARNGYDGTSVRKIAETAQMNVAMISYYFGSKEELLKAILIYRLADYRTQIETVLSENSDWFEKVDTLVKVTVEKVHDNRRLHKIIHSENTKANRSLDFQEYINYRVKNYKAIEQFIQSGQEAGVFSKDVVIPLLTTTIIGSYLNFYYNQGFYKKIYNFKADLDFENYVYTTLIPHIQKTIKGLLSYDV